MCWRTESEMEGKKCEKRKEINQQVARGEAEGGF